MTVPAALIEKLDSPVRDVELSVFRDRHGAWAKDWDSVASVYIEFDDGTQFTIEPADFRALTSAQQRKVRYAPSSPLPPP